MGNIRDRRGPYLLAPREALQVPMRLGSDRCSGDLSPTLKVSVAKLKWGSNILRV